MEIIKTCLIALVILLAGFTGYQLIKWTNTIFAIQQNHGIEVPESTTNIDVHSYCWVIDLCMDGNVSVMQCEMEKKRSKGFYVPKVDATLVMAPENLYPFPTL